MKCLYPDRPMPETVPPGSSSTAPSGPGPGAEALVGRTFGDYHVLRRLGQGGMGQVFLADQLSLKRRVALKFLRPDHLNETTLKRFRAEAEAVARLSHPNIVQVYAIGEVDGLQYMALEFVEGRTLRDVIDKKGQFTVQLALLVIRQVAMALQRAASLGIVHRDIKPENILLNRKGDVKVADFGLLRRVIEGPQDLSLTQSGQTLGTPLYMSPEQVQGKQIDPRSDIYSLGVTAYHMLAGRPPFNGKEAIEVALKHINAEPPPLAEIRPDVSSVLVSLVHRMMSKDPAARPQTGREVIRDLAGVHTAPPGGEDNPFAGLHLPAPALAKTEAIPAAPTPPPSVTVTVPVPTRRPRPALMVAGSILLALACGVGLRLMLGGPPPPAPSRPAEPLPPSGPIVSDTERFLLQAVDQYATPKQPDKIREGAGHHVELANIYFDRREYGKADHLFEGMKTAEGTPLQYKTIGDLGLAIVAAMRDDVEQSNKRFQEINGKRPQVMILFTAILPAEAAEKLRYWVVTALDRNATRNPLSPALADLRNKIKNPPKPPIGPKGKAGK